LWRSPDANYPRKTLLSYAYTKLFSGWRLAVVSTSREHVAMTVNDLPLSVLMLPAE
jgi:hypothetical protein